MDQGKVLQAGEQRVARVESMGAIAALGVARASAPGYGPAMIDTHLGSYRVVEEPFPRLRRWSPASAPVEPVAPRHTETAPA